MSYLDNVGALLSMLSGLVIPLTPLVTPDEQKHQIQEITPTHTSQPSTDSLPYKIPQCTSYNAICTNSLSSHLIEPPFENCFSAPCRAFKLITVGVDFLWWKSLVDDLDCGYTSQGNFANLFAGGDALNFKYKALSTQWKPGARAALTISQALCHFDASFSFTWIKSQAKNCFSVPDQENSSNHLINTLIQPFLDYEIGGYTTNMSAEWSSKYINADALLSAKINLNSCGHVAPYLGLAGIYFKQKQNAQSFSNIEFGPSGRNQNAPTEYMNWKADYWGVGLKLGGSFEQPCCRFLKLFGNINATLLAGKTIKSNNSQNLLVDFEDNHETYTTFTYEQPSFGTFVPGCHLQTGFNYNGTLWCREFTIRLGYEFLYWLNLPNPRRFDLSLVEDQETLGAYMGRVFGANTRSVGFHGLFAGVDMVF